MLLRRRQYEQEKKIILWIIGSLILIVALVAIIVRCSISSGSKKATQIAQEYLSQKYSQEMQYSSVRFSWVDPSLYHVTFFPKSNPNLFFEVLVQSDLTLRDQINEYGNFTPDNYYLNYFSFEVRSIIQKNVYNIWGENAQALVPVEGSSLYAHKVPIELNEQMTIQEMEPYLEYDFSIKTKVLLDNSTKESEAHRILELIQIVKASQFKPKEFRIWYLTGNDEKNKVTTDSSTWSEMYIEFNEWTDITTVDEIQHIMDEQWFHK